ncbi:MAG TPA: sugar transferase [Caulobacteraceae bacterium]|nr:sugar transferase [Caulobacteraceae bacterium]
MAHEYESQAGASDRGARYRDEAHAFAAASPRQWTDASPVARRPRREAVIVQYPGARPAPPALSRGKRALDLVGAVVAIILFLPLLLIIAAAIRLESPGPAVFRQRRGGLNGRTFTIYKFRTMRAQEDGDVILQAYSGDERITWLGRLLRRTSMDELPQLVNVLKGEMSLVGPRPHALAHDRFYGELIPDYARRLRTRPGLTGLAQVAGLRGETREIDLMAERVRHDLRYIEEWSLLLDLQLIAGTAQALAAREAR